MAPEAIRRGIAAFRGVAHRIERVREDAGVVYYNDSKGTNVDSTIKALESFTEPVVLIAGGKGKGQDFEPLTRAARGRVRHAVLIGVDREQLRGPLERGRRRPSRTPRSMEAAVLAARAAAARRATSCCCRPPAPPSTCSTTSSTAATCSRPRSCAFAPDAAQAHARTCGSSRSSSSSSRWAW